MSSNLHLATCGHPAGTKEAGGTGADYRLKAEGVIAILVDRNVATTTRH